MCIGKMATIWVARVRIYTIPSSFILSNGYRGGDYKEVREKSPFGVLIVRARFGIIKTERTAMFLMKFVTGKFRIAFTWG